MAPTYATICETVESKIKDEMTVILEMAFHRGLLPGTGIVAQCKVNADKTDMVFSKQCRRCKAEVRI